MSIEPERPQEEPEPEPRRRRAVGAVVLLAGLAALAVARVAIVDEGGTQSGPCSLDLTVDGADRTLAGATARDPILLPPRGDAAIEWRAEVEEALHDYQGGVSLVVGPAEVALQDWEGPNKPDDAVEASGVARPLKGFPMQVAGLYRVEVAHRAAEADCTGVAYVRITGSPLGTLPGMLALLLAIPAAVWLAFSWIGRPGRRRGRPIVGGIAGLLLGVLVSINLQQLGVRPLDSMGLYVLPAGMAVLGVAGGLVGPLGRPERRARRRLVVAAAALTVLSLIGAATVAVAQPGELPDTDLPGMEVAVVVPPESPCPEGVRARGVQAAFGRDRERRVNRLGETRFAVGDGKLVSVERTEVTVADEAREAWIAVVYWGRQGGDRTSHPVCGTFFLHDHADRATRVRLTRMPAHIQVDEFRESPARLARRLRPGNVYRFRLPTSWDPQECEGERMCAWRTDIAAHLDYNLRLVGLIEGERVDIGDDEIGWIERVIIG